MSAGPPSSAPSRDLLLANHVFPGEYVVKVFGPGHEQFRTRVTACAVEVVGEARVAVSERWTRSHHKMCVTLTLEAQTVDEVIAVYEQVHGVPQVMLVL